MWYTCEQGSLYASAPSCQPPPPSQSPTHSSPCTPLPSLLSSTTCSLHELLTTDRAVNTCRSHVLLLPHPQPPAGSSSPNLLLVYGDEHESIAKSLQLPRDLPLFRQPPRPSSCIRRALSSRASTFLAPASCAGPRGLSSLAPSAGSRSGQRRPCTSHLLAVLLASLRFRLLAAQEKRLR